MPHSNEPARRERARVAVAVDAIRGADRLLAELDNAFEPVAVLVPPNELLMARSVLPAEIRCVTHPHEVAPSTFDLWIVPRDIRGLAHHRELMRQMHPIVRHPADLASFGRRAPGSPVPAVA